jgi:hypothetical protein
MFSKRLQELTAADVQGVVTSQLQEGGEVEFKETLPAKTGEDRWIKDQQQIGDYARNEILAEVIAFANAFGGTMVLGIAETDDKPARAKAVVPLPKSVELADRLRLQCRDCIEPQIPMLEVVGVPVEPDGAGVVVFRTPRSRMAPHRHTVTRECYVRRADRTEKMTMREIQDLTLNVERGLTAIETEFARAAKAFGERFNAFTGSRRAFGMRVTGVPIVPISIENLQKNPAAYLPLVRIFGLVEKDKEETKGKQDTTVELFVPTQHVNYRPTLRGIDGKGGSDEFALELYGRANGLVEYRLMATLGEPPEARARAIYPSWVLGIVANCICGIERYRRLAAAIEVEYGLELEVVSTESLHIGKYGGSHFGDFLGPFPSGQTIFPRYSVGGAEEFTELGALVERDFWNAAGHAFDARLLIDFKRAFNDLGF